jgi:hypothetical protein
MPWEQCESMCGRAQPWMISTVGSGCALLDLRLVPYIARAGRETPTTRKLFPARAKRRRNTPTYWRRARSTVFAREQVIVGGRPPWNVNRHYRPWRCHEKNMLARWRCPRRKQSPWTCTTILLSVDNTNGRAWSLWTSDMRRPVGDAQRSIDGGFLATAAPGAPRQPPLS